MSSTSSGAGVTARPLLFNKSQILLWSNFPFRAPRLPSLLALTLSVTVPPFKESLSSTSSRGVWLYSRVNTMAFELLHCQEISRLLFSHCHTKILEWRHGNHILPYGKGSFYARQMRCINGVLAMEPGTTYSTGQATVNHHTRVLTNSPEIPVFMGTAQNHTFLQTSKASVDRSLLEKVNSKEVEKQIKEIKERARRAKISEANKGRVPWNKGKRGDCITIDGVTLQTQVNVSITNEEKEFLRRQRISQANRGKVPWNKGGKHTSETKERIRAGVIERMKDPKIREKLRLQAEAVKLSPEIKMKIRTGILRAWVAKKKRKLRQELCLLEWREVIAETARRGCEGDTEYQWNSYSMLRKLAREAIPRMKKDCIPRSHLSAEHRLRISAAIKAKWSNPDYRISVEKGIKKSVSKRVVVPSRIRPKNEPRRTFSRPLKGSARPLKSRINGDLVNVALSGMATEKSAPKTRTPRPISSRSNHIKNPAIVRHVVHTGKGTLRAGIMEVDCPKPNNDIPSYKDPEAEKKLEKLKSMRAHRMHLESQKQEEITQRARALIAQAQEAAKALEAAAVMDKNALAPLLETRKLLAEAVHSLESLNRKSSIPDYEVKEEDSALYTQVMSLANAVSSPVASVNNHSEPESSG